MASLTSGDLFDVNGLVAVVTGGGSGIGLMITKALESNGATVFIVGRRLEVLEQAAKEHNKHGKIIPIRGDVSSKQSLQEVAAKVKERAGYINLLVNNSGISGPSSTDRPKDQSVKEFVDYYWNQASEADFTKIFDVNVTGVFYCTLAFLELLEAGNQKGRGIEGVSSQVITISSIAGFRRDKNVISFAYQSSKAATTHLGKTFASVLPQFNIRSNIVAPGFFPSEMAGSIIADMNAPVSIDFIPSQRYGRTEDIVGLILYLASKAGAYVNGNVSVVDGGRLSVVSSTY